MIKRRFIFMSIILILAGAERAQAQGLKGLFKKAKKEVKNEVDKATSKTGIPNSSKKQKGAEKEVDIKVDFGPSLKFDSPSEEFESFEIQTWNGLMRFGMLYDYGKTSDKKNFQSLDGKVKLKYWEKNKLDIAAFERFKFLSEIKYLKHWYEDMDRDYFTTQEEVNLARPQNGNGDEAEYLRLSNSANAQAHLKSVAFSLTSKMGKNNYFCNPERGDCEELAENAVRTDDRGRRVVVKSGIYSQWGGSQSSEFTQLRKYKSFSENQLRVVQKWADDIWAKGYHEVYYVEPIKMYNFKSYDFKNKGYWMRLDLGVSSVSGTMVKSNGKSGPFTMTYMPKSRYEKERESGDLLFKIGAEKAEKLSSSRSGLAGYAVYKIKIYKIGYSKKNIYDRNKSWVDWGFNLSSPVVELYSDLALTNKIGSISLENAIYK